MLLTTVIALKGAMLGKLKPGGVLGLPAALDVSKPPRLGKGAPPDGTSSALRQFAIALVASPFVHYAATFVAIGGIVIVGVTAAAIESWRVWRDDPEREISRQ